MEVHQIHATREAFAALRCGRGGGKGGCGDGFFSLRFVGGSEILVKGVAVLRWMFLGFLCVESGISTYSGLEETFAFVYIYKYIQIYIYIYIYMYICMYTGPAVSANLTSKL